MQRRALHAGHECGYLLGEVFELFQDMIIQKIEQVFSKFQKSGNQATPQLESKA